MTLEFIGATLLVVIVPGAGVLYVLDVGLSRGAHAGVAAAFGCTLGIVPHVAVVVSGLAALLHAGTTVFHVVQALGVLYLFYLAWVTWRDRNESLELGRSVPRSVLKVTVGGALVNSTNPKLILFFLSFFPQFSVSDGHPDSGTLLVQGFVFMLATLVIFVAYGLLAAAVCGRAASSPRIMTWVRSSFAVIFLGLGLQVAFSQLV